MLSVVLENDEYIECNSFLSYIEKNELERTFIFNADQVNTDTILLAFSTCEVLEFKPTMITFSQYNLMMMAMFKLIKSNMLSIKEIHIFSHNEELEDELKELWKDKTRYLEQVLQLVKIFQVYHDLKKELSLI